MSGPNASPPQPVSRRSRATLVFAGLSVVLVGSALASLACTLPKQRALGLAFDDATHKSFLSFIERQDSCKGEQELSGRVDTAVERLKKEFAGQ